MFIAITLLNPVYITFFWLVILNFTGRNSTEPKRFLGKFMIFAFLVYLSHFFFYLPVKEIYPFIDSTYQLASLIVYPMYYIYVRMLTVDEIFNWKKHRIYLIVPFGLTFLYQIGVLFSPWEEYSSWVFNRNECFDIFSLCYLKILFLVIRVVFVVQVIYYMASSFSLLRRYGHKAGQYYSDEEDSQNRNVKIINYSMMLTGISSLVIGMLGRDFFINEILFRTIVSFVFSILLFIIGLLGMVQKAVNPTFEEKEFEEDNTDNEMEQEKIGHKALLKKILFHFEVQKVHLKENLTIMDLAHLTGSNRTYISNVINHFYHQNFSTFVNSYRVQDVKACILDEPDITNIILAEKCGFSSTESLKRVIKSQTGMSVTELKHLINK